MADPNEAAAAAEYIDTAAIRDDASSPRAEPALDSADGTAFRSSDIDRQVERAIEVAKDRGAAWLEKIRAQARERPGLVAGLALAFTVAAVIAGAYGLRNRKPRWRRELEAYGRALADGVEVRVRVSSAT